MQNKFMYEKDACGYSILDKSDIEAIHETTLEVMSETGVKAESKTAQEYFIGAGCTVDRETDMVKFPPNVVNDAICSAPGRVLLAARDPDQDIVLEGKRVYFKNFATGLTVLDPYTKELRESTKKDLSDIARFCDALPEVDFFTLAVAAQDVDPRVKDLHELEAVLSNTTKHFSHDAQNLKNARVIIDMAACVCGGRENLRKRPIISMGVCTLSPLELCEECTDMIIEAAKNGIPMNVLAMGLAGATTPVTMAGTLVSTNAEVLGGIVLSQLVEKGAPVMYGTSNTIMDLRFATSPVGAPEHAMFSAAVGQIGHYYDIPTDVGGT